MSSLKMVAVMSNPILLNNVLGAMKDLVRNVNIDCNESGLQIQCTDSSNVGLVHLMMYSTAFESFACPKSMSLGVSVDHISKVLKLCGSTDKLTLEADPESTKVIWTFESTSDQRMAKFEMGTMDIEQEALGIPDTKYEAVVKMPTSAFKKAVSDLNGVGDVLIMTAGKGGLRLEINGDFGTANLLLPTKESSTEDESLTIDLVSEEKEVTLSFGMRYISLFTRASALCKSCTLNMTTAEPITLQYNLGEESHGFLRFLLAPKLDDF